MASANPPISPFSGAVLVDKAIRAAVGSGDIRIVIPDPNRLGREPNQEARFPFDDLTQYIPALNPVDPAKDGLPGCLESTGYKLYPLRYYDRRGGKWKLIPQGKVGLTLQPGKEVVIEPQQYVGFSHKYCALHFARFSGQLSGSVIATGLIQPEWGGAREAPIFTSIRNIGRATIHITRHESLSRLVFFRVSDEISNRGHGTTLEFIRDRIEEDQANSRAREVRAVWSRRLAYGAGFVGLGSALYWLPLVLPLAGVNPGINQYFGNGIVAVLAFLAAQFISAERRSDL